MSNKADDRLKLVKNHINPAQPATSSRGENGQPVTTTDASYYKCLSVYVHQPGYTRIETAAFQTKWHENDMYDHLNNAVYITYFDAIINEYLIKVCKVSPSSNKTPIGLVIASNIQYQAALEFPEPVLAGLAVKKLGSTSVTYAVALFKAEEQTRSTDLHSNSFTRSLKLQSGKAASTAEMTHVFVDPTTRRPVKIEGQLRQELSKLLVE